MSGLNFLGHTQSYQYINKYRRPSEVLGEGWGNVKLLLCLAPMSSRKAYWFIIWPRESDICIPKPWRHQNEDTASLPTTGVTEPGPALNSLATLKGVMTMGGRWRWGQDPRRWTLPWGCCVSCDTWYLLHLWWAPGLHPDSPWQNSHRGISNHLSSQASSRVSKGKRELMPTTQPNCWWATFSS